MAITVEQAALRLEAEAERMQKRDAWARAHELRGEADTLRRLGRHAETLPPARAKRSR